MDERETKTAGEQVAVAGDGHGGADTAKQPTAAEKTKTEAAPEAERESGTRQSPLRPVALSFTYTKQEYLKAARHYLFASKAITWRNVILVGVLVVFALVYGVLGGFNTGSVVLLVLGGVVVLLGCILYFFIPAHSYNKTEKYHQAYRLEFTPEDIHFTTPCIDSRLSWTTYTDAWESAEVFYLLTGPQAYTIVPKRAFEDDRQLEDFHALLAVRVVPAKRV